MKNFAVPSANAQAKRRHVPVAKFHTIFEEPSHISYMVIQALSIICTSVPDLGENSLIFWIQLNSIIFDLTGSYKRGAFRPAPQLTFFCMPKRK